MKPIARTGEIRTRAKALSGSRPLVVLVEDSRTFTLVLAHRFREEAGADVVICNTLRSFRELVAAREQQITLAVVDLNLEDSPNREVLDFTSQENIPSIVFTGTFDFNTRAHALKKNVIDYVVKDNELAFDAIVAAVRRVLDNRNVRVLVVGGRQSSDENPVVGMMQLQQFLVVHAAGRGEAMDVLQRFPDIELALIDDGANIVGGLELVRDIRRGFPSERLRIIALSCEDGPFLSAAYLKAGASDFLRMPFVQEEFQCRVVQNVETIAHIKRLKAIASRDFLTDMYNRRYFFEYGPVLVKHSLERGEACCAVVLDIDHFKKFNDVYGHDVGDLVLKTVARKLREMIDSEFHLVARLGGEEFGILLRNMAVKEATEYCDMIREEIGRASVVHEEEELSVTVSLGVAEVIEDEDFSNYLNAADQYLYMAKKSGRDRVYSDYSIMQLFADRRDSAIKVS